MAPLVNVSAVELGKTNTRTEIEVCLCINSVIVEGDMSLSTLSINTT